MSSRKELTEKIVDSNLSREQLAELLSSIVQTADRTQAQGFLHFNTIEEPLNEQVRRNVAVFRFDLELNVTTDSSVPHILIEGDNLTALSGLNFTHKNKVDVIYIDPPYNTGSEDFRYNDRFVSEDDGWSSSKWLSMMEPRLRLAKNLLRSTGVIIVAIGNDEDARLKLLMDSIFGRQNFIARINWATEISKNNSKFVSNVSDFMFVYAKSVNTLRVNNIEFRQNKTGVTQMQEKALSIWNETCDSIQATKLFRSWMKGLPLDHPVRALKGNAAYNGIDNDGKIFRPTSLAAPREGGPRYEVIHPVTGQPVPLPQNGWRCKKEVMDQYIKDQRILFGKDHFVGINYKRYMDESTTSLLADNFKVDRIASNKELAAILGPNMFPFPKDRNVLAQWIDYVTPEFRKNDTANPPVILDFFAGSGSTGHAVLQLNAQDDIQRQFILVTNNEGDICRGVTQPRLKSVMTGIWADGKAHEPLKGNLAFFTSGLFEPRSEWAPDSLEIVNNRSRVEEEDVHEFTRQGHAVFAIAENAPLLLVDDPERGFSMWTSNPGSKDSRAVVVYYDITVMKTEDFLKDVLPKIDEKFTGEKIVCIPQDSESDFYIHVDQEEHPDWRVVATPDQVFGSWKMSKSALMSNHSTDYFSRVMNALNKS